MRNKIISLLSILLTSCAAAQKTVIDSSRAAGDPASPGWSFEMNAYHYFLPAEKNTTTLLGYADHKALHLEARYNYEDVNTASVFGGYRIETGHKLMLTLVPMIGIVFGNTDGIVPGLETSLAWKKFDFYAEGEYVIDLNGEENNFFYTWTELAITPFKNFRTGISANRTRLYQSGLDLQRGVFAQYSFWKLTAGVHYFNPFTDSEFVIATLGIEF
ncbi:MAG TPA: hypothetical protein VIZ28_11680 [Chitinophagaceae bacterium]